MTTIDVLYCDVEDLNKAFYPELERLQIDIHYGYPFTRN